MQHSIQDVSATIAQKLNLKPEDIFGKDLKISEVVALSPTAINSIDMLEAFAGSFAEHGIDSDMDLPAFTMDDKIDGLMSEVDKQLQKLSGGA